VTIQPFSCCPYHETERNAALSNGADTHILISVGLNVTTKQPIIVDRARGIIIFIWQGKITW